MTHCAILVRLVIHILLLQALGIEPQLTNSFEFVFHIWCITEYHLYSPLKPSMFLQILLPLVMITFLIQRVVVPLLVCQPTSIIQLLCNVNLGYVVSIGRSALHVRWSLIWNLHFFSCFSSFHTFIYVLFLSLRSYKSSICH